MLCGGSFPGIGSILGPVVSRCVLVSVVAVRSVLSVAFGCVSVVVHCSSGGGGGGVLVYWVPRWGYWRSWVCHGFFCGAISVCLLFSSGVSWLFVCNGFFWPGIWVCCGFLWYPLCHVLGDVSSSMSPRTCISLLGRTIRCSLHDLLCYFWPASLLLVDSG